MGDPRQTVYHVLLACHMSAAEATLHIGLFPPLPSLCIPYLQHDDQNSPFGSSTLYLVESQDSKSSTPSSHPIFLAPLRLQHQSILLSHFLFGLYLHRTASSSPPSPSRLTAPEGGKRGRWIREWGAGARAAARGQDLPPILRGLREDFREVSFPLGILHLYKAFHFRNWILTRFTPQIGPPRTSQLL